MTWALENSKTENHETQILNKLGIESHKKQFLTLPQAKTTEKLTQASAKNVLTKKKRH